MITEILVVSTLGLAAYVYSLSYSHGLFKKLGIVGPTPWPVSGTMHKEFFGKEGMFVFHIKSYLEHKKDKVYGLFRAEKPTMVLCDVDMIREICVKKFEDFPNRVTFDMDPPLGYALTEIKDDHWKNVRHTVSPSFSTNKLKKMFPHIKRNTNILLDYLHGKMEANEPVELKQLISEFTMDTIASTGFGIEANSLGNESSEFTKHGQTLISGSQRFMFILMFLNFLRPVLKIFGFEAIPKETSRFFSSFVDNAYEMRKQDKDHSRADFIQLMMEAQTDNEEEQKQVAKGTSEQGEESAGGDSTGKKGGGLTYQDIQGQAMIFMLAGYDTVATCLSFTLFYLAMIPECLEKAQQEVDTLLPDGKSPDYETAQSMTYLEMCLNEALRLFPPGLIIDRMAKVDTEVNGVKIPKGVSVTFPVCGIHRDPELWEDPDKFDPERHTVENKADRHPYAFMPFGMGPRNCIGMRLALLEMKMALASILQRLRPVSCDQTVYPIVCDKFQVKAVDGLWVKFEPRK